MFAPVLCISACYYLKFFLCYVLFSVCSFFRKPVIKKNIRKHTIDNEDDEGDSNSESSLLHFSSGSTKTSASAEPCESGKPGKSSEDEKFYKGSGKGGGAHGPLKASAHIRVSTRFDYQPDMCKDYKESGYCGYDLGGYKSGWQLEKEWEEAKKMRLAGGSRVHSYVPCSSC